MTIQAMSWVFGLPSQEITPTERLVLLALANRANEDGYCWPGLRNLGDETSLSRRTIQVAIQTLILKGLVSKETRIIGGRQTSNGYWLEIFKGAANAGEGAAAALPGVHDVLSFKPQIETKANDQTAGEPATAGGKMKPKPGITAAEIAKSIGDKPKWTPETLLKYYEAKPLNGNTLEMFWRSMLRLHFPTLGPTTELTRKQVGQLKQVAKKLGTEPLRRLAVCLGDWAKFTKYCEQNYGAKTSAQVPQIGYVLQYVQCVSGFADKASGKVKLIAIPDKPAPMPAKAILETEKPMTLTELAELEKQVGKLT